MQSFELFVTYWSKIIVEIKPFDAGYIVAEYERMLADQDHKREIQEIILKFKQRLELSWGVKIVCRSDNLLAWILKTDKSRPDPYPARPIMFGRSGRLVFPHTGIGR